MSSKQEEQSADFTAGTTRAPTTTVSASTLATEEPPLETTPSSSSSATNKDQTTSDSAASTNKTGITTLAWSSRTNNSTSTKRAMCARCHRPAPQACICASLPAEPIALTQSRILILQHPHEARRKNRSVPLLQLALEEHSSCIVAVGRRLGDQVTRSMMEIIEDEKEPLLLLYPGPKAVSLQEAMKQLKERQSTSDDDSSPPRRINVLVLDGTWKYAKEMNQANDYPERIIQIQLDPVKDIPNFTSGRFEIRPPPAPNYVSTAECIAWVVSQLERENEKNENNNNLYHVLLKPLDYMVQKWKGFAGSKRSAATAIETNDANDGDGASRNAKQVKTS